MSDASTVEAWQFKMCLPCGDQNFDDPKFKMRRAKLITEEYLETMQALGCEAQAAVWVGMDYYGAHVKEKADKVAFLDGLCDLNWVCLGSAAELGWDFDGAFAEVARSNFSKAGGKVDANGKLQKPEGYSPPNLADFVK